MELAVNIPEHEPQVGQADCSMARLLRRIFGRRCRDHGIDQVDGFRSPSSTTLPASMGPPDTKIVGMFSRRAAMSIPGVILSQLEMQTMHRRSGH